MEAGEQHGGQAVLSLSTGRWDLDKGRDYGGVWDGHGVDEGGGEGRGKDREVRVVTPGSGQDRAAFSQVSSGSSGRCLVGSRTLSLEPRRKV